jgi:hypothetical protein
MLAADNAETLSVSRGSRDGNKCFARSQSWKINGSLP